MSAIELIDVIDNQNQVVGSVTKQDIYSCRLQHRVVHVFVIDQDRILFSTRSSLVRYLPGFLCSSAAGHVQAGETPYQGAIRELREELGLGGPVHLVDQFFWTHEFRIHISIFVKQFNQQSDVLELDPYEIASADFYTTEELGKLGNERLHPQLRPCLESLESYFRFKKGGI